MNPQKYFSTTTPRRWVFIILLGGLTLTAGAENTKNAAAFYFPPQNGAWETITPASVGWNKAKLEAALEYAGAQKSSGVVILHRGKILAERHWKMTPTGNEKAKQLAYFQRLQVLDNGHAKEDIASAQKSVVSFLTGIAQEKGFLQLDDPVSKHLGVGWSRASTEQESKITLRHLISMSSGLNEGLTYQAPPGTKWKYNTDAYGMTLRALSAATGLERNELTRLWLTDKIGMAHTEWIARPGADLSPLTNPVGLSTTARDLARFGLLVQANGVWNGQVILGDNNYLQTSLQTSQKMNPAYGYLWWLNGHRRMGKTGTWLAKEAPADLVAAQGALGRKLYIVPSLDLVVTRIGNEAAQSFNNEFWKRLMAAAPKP